jgi:AAA15 family ATPase/GTPase
MLKSITFSNLLSFKHETTVDFEVYKKNSHAETVYEYKKRNVGTSHLISNISLIYGKNNSGKTNLLHIISSIFSFIELNYKKDKTPFTRFATTTNKNIEVEIELVADDNMYRYGFVLDKNNKVISEWMYANRNKSISESMIFERFKTKSDITDFKTTDFLNNYKSTLSKLSTDKLFVSFLGELQIDELQSFNNIVKSVSRTFNIERNVEDNLSFYYIEQYYNDKVSQNRLIDFLKDFDTNIDVFNVEKLSEDYLNQVEEFSKILKKSQTDNLKTEDIFTKLVEHFGEDQFSSLTKPTFIIGEKSETENTHKAFSFSATFTDNKTQEKYDMPYHALSFGTRKLIVLLMSIIYAKEGTIFLVDELEHGFHKVLLIKLITLLLNSIKGKRIQIIASTHEEDLLDLKQIENESKILINNNGSSKIEYVSSFKVRKELKLSKRYLIGAFKGTPVISGVQDDQ